jgi:hypothetical protein
MSLEQPIPFLLRFVYGAGLAFVVLGCVGFFGYRTYRRKMDKPGPEKPPEGESGGTAA